jgi:hypothetical protein
MDDSSRRVLSFFSECELGSIFAKLLVEASREKALLTEYMNKGPMFHDRPSVHIGSPRLNLGPFLEPFIAESAPYLLSGSS